MPSVRPSLGACALLTLVACSSPADGPSSPDAPQLAKPAPADSNAAATFVFPLDEGSLGLRSDGRSVTASGFTYADGECGVIGTVFVGGTVASGDARIQTDGYRDRRCADWPRRISIDYGDGVPRLITAAINVTQLQRTGMVIPKDSTRERGLNIVDERCQGLRWRPVLNDGTVTGGDYVDVTRLDARRWLVQSKPHPYNKAYCIAEDTTFNIAVRFVVVADRDLPM